MLVRNGLVFTGGAFLRRDLRIADGVFCELAPAGRLTLADGEECVDADACYVLPGLVDVHSHGRAGEDFSFAGQEALRKLCRSYATCGVTSVLATTMTNEPTAIRNAMREIGSYRAKQKPDGARLLGIHMEGPFLGKEKKGAHDERYLRPIEEAWFAQMQEESRQSIRLVSLDPTLPGAEAWIGRCREQGIRISLAHTTCDYETAVRAVRAGADHVTHLFNAMNPLHHRKPGLIGAAFDCGLYTELICDGIHLHPAVIRMMFAMNPGKMILISDSMQAAGLPDGAYSLGGLSVQVSGGRASLSDGTIAGSTTDVFSAMVHAISFGVPKEEAVLSASRIPAESIGMEDRIGSIAEGLYADFLLTDKEFHLKEVCIRGEILSKL